MSKLKKISAILLILVLTLSMGVSILADNSSIIDPTETGSITIHKFDRTGSVGAVPADGTLITDTSTFGSPLGGITFKVTLIPGATPNTTVVQAQNIINAMSETELDEYQDTDMTGLGGVCTFEDLVQGIYLVEEVPNERITDTIAAFLVSIPMTNPSNHSSWLYDIHVYPKNTMAAGTIDKKVLDDEGDQQFSINANVGDEVEWVITATFPGSMSSIDPNNENEGYFYITDNLDSRLNYKSVKVELVRYDGSTREELVAGVHYKLTAPDEGDPGTGKDDIIVDFKTAAGLEKLILTPVDSTIQVTVTTVINETAVTNLQIPIKNDTALYFNNEDGDPSNPTDPPLEPTDPIPEIDLLGIAIKKVDENGVLLNDATFTIYKTINDAKAGDAVQLNSSDWTETSGSSLKVVGSDPVTYYKGYIYFSSADFDNAGLDATKYYFVETTAPAGYELLNEIYEVELGMTETITNRQSPGSDFTLPITGGSGTLLFTIVGVLLIGGAVTLLIVARKRKKTASK